MPARLIALDEGNDIILDRSMVVVGRHPHCDVRLDSLRISRHHCCMTPEPGALVVKDLGSTNGIRINGDRVERGRLKPGDELSIAHIRFRYEGAAVHDATIVDNDGSLFALKTTNDQIDAPTPVPQHPLAHAVRSAIGDLGEDCQIQVIVHVKEPTNIGMAARVEP